VRFWWLTLTPNQVLRLGMLKMSLRNDDDGSNNSNNNNNNNKPQQKSKHRLQQMVDYQPRYCLKEEHKYSSFCQSSKRCEKKGGSTHQHRKLTTVC